MVVTWVWWVTDGGGDVVSLVADEGYACFFMKSD